MEPIRLHAFVVLEEPADPAERFDGSLLADPRVVRTMRGDPAVTCDIRPEYAEAFGAWTEANVGLPMAIVMEGEVRSAPHINARLTRSVQITMGPNAGVDAEREADALAAILKTGALKVPLRVIEVVKAPGVPFIYIGFSLFLVGLVLALYIQPYLRRSRRSAKEAEPSP